MHLKASSSKQQRGYYIISQDSIEEKKYINSQNFSFWSTFCSDGCQSEETCKQQ